MHSDAFCRAYALEFCFLRRQPVSGGSVRLGHAAGVMPVSVRVRQCPEHGWDVEAAGFVRTARYLVQGTVFSA